MISSFPPALANSLLNPSNLFPVRGWLVFSSSPLGERKKIEESREYNEQIFLQRRTWMLAGEGEYLILETFSHFSLIQKCHFNGGFLTETEVFFRGWNTNEK